MYRYIVSSKSTAKNVINTNSTGVSYYDNFLNSSDLKYMENAKNRTGEVVYMSPNEYYTECADSVFHVPVSNLISQRNGDADSINYLSSIIDSGKQFDLPYINYADAGQEGLHRMMVLGDAFGWNTKFPVLIVDYFDERAEIVHEAKVALHKAVTEALEYKYDADDLVNDFLSEVQYELDRRADEYEETNYTAVVTHTSTDTIYLSLKGFESDFKEDIDKEDIQIRTESDKSLDFDDDLLDDLDDIDLDNLLFK